MSRPEQQVNGGHGKRRAPGDAVDTEPSDQNEAQAQVQRRLHTGPLRHGLVLIGGEHNGPGGQVRHRKKLADQQDLNHRTGDLPVLRPHPQANKGFSPE